MTVSANAETIVIDTNDFKLSIKENVSPEKLKSADEKVLRDLCKPYLYLKDDFPEQRILAEILYNVKMIKELSSEPQLLKEITSDILQKKKLSKEMQIIGLRASRRALKLIANEIALE